MVKKIAKIVYIVIAVAMILASLGLWGFSAINYWQKNEPFTKEKDTTVECIQSLTTMKLSLSYSSIFRKSFKAYKDEKDNGTFVIPGLNATRTMRAGTADMCTNMVPQSVCVVKDYLVIGAYCHTHTHYSVLYVLDKETKEYIKTIVLPGRHHVGGISWDRVHDTVWISCFKKHAQANCVTLEDIENYDFHYAKRPIRFFEENDLYTIPKNSFLACDNGYLYVGYFQVKDSSVLQKFAIDYETGRLVKEDSDRYQQSYGSKLPSEIVVPVNVATISSKVQGLTFSAYRMYVTESCGVGLSKLAVFSVFDDEEEHQDYRNENAVSVLTLPQKLEQITVDGEDMYSIYESAAYSYRFYSFPVIDRVIRMKVEDVKAAGRKQKEREETREELQEKLEEWN